MAASTSPSPLHEAPNYDEEIDFAELALQDADFARVYNAENGKVDFQDPKALQQLTKSLLRKDFGLSIELPDDRLCPPVPVRYKYIRWVQDLLDTTSPTNIDTYDPNRKVTGLDIGVGSSCIYPLLATSTRPQWTIYGTDIDSQNLTYAQQNVDTNNFSSHIYIRRSTVDNPLFPLPALGVKTLDFTMCNPPFYSSKADLEASYANKSAPPSAVCTGADVEMICEGGDLGFVLQMVKESLVLREKVQWYTSMLGKSSSVVRLVERLKEVGVTNWAVVCLRAGNKTRRWAVGWSFGDWRPRQDVARRGELPASLHPLPTAQTIYTSGLSRTGTADLLNALLSALPVRWTWDSSASTGAGHAKENVWSRAARRKAKRLAENAEMKTGAGAGEKEGEDEDVALAFKIEIVSDEEMEVRWVRGQDFVLFESFCGLVKREVAMKAPSQHKSG